MSSPFLYFEHHFCACSVTIIMERTTGSYASFQLFRFSGLKERLAAFRDMGVRALEQEHRAPVFSRHLGSGAGSGFSLWPDWSTYGYFATWQSEEELDMHLQEKNYSLPWSNYAVEQLKVGLQCVQVHGKWDGAQPLKEASVDHQGRIAVLTRARVRGLRLHRFWSHVGQAARAIEDAPGCLFTKGVGEWPLAMQATFSIWESLDAMRHFAYTDKGHREIVEKTRREKWYSEDMFARFEIKSISGSYRDLKMK